MKAVKLGLIGLGFQGRIHLRSCTKLRNAKLTTVCDTSKKALNYAKKWGIKRRFTDYHKLLEDENIDAVIIALPTFLHRTAAETAAEAGKNILLEKPLARSVKEGKEILSAADRNGVKLMVGYQMRFHPPFIQLKEKMDDGILGEIQTAYATYIQAGPFSHRSERHIPRPVPEWWFHRELTGGGSLIDMGCHIINLLRWYFGDITDIQSYLKYRFNLEVEDNAICLAKFNSGPLSIINLGWFSQRLILRIELNGTMGHTSVQRESQNFIVTAFKRLLTSSSDWTPFTKELEHFVECITHDFQPGPSGADALKDLEAIELAYENRHKILPSQSYRYPERESLA